VAIHCVISSSFVSSGAILIHCCISLSFDPVTFCVK
jgi:hypothetical protein